MLIEAIPQTLVGSSRFKASLTFTIVRRVYAIVDTDLVVEIEIRDKKPTGQANLRSVSTMITTANVILPPILETEFTISITPEVKKVLRTSSTISSSFAWNLPECHTQLVYQIRRMSTIYPEGHDIRFEISDGFVYNSDIACYSKPQIVYRFRVPYYGVPEPFESLMEFVPTTLITVRLGKFNRSLDLQLEGIPQDFTKAEANFSYKYTNYFENYKRRTGSSTLASKYGILSISNGVFGTKSSLILKNTISGVSRRFRNSNSNLITTYGRNYNIFRKRESINNSLPSTFRQISDNFRRRVSPNNVYPATLKISDVFLESKENLSFVTTITQPNQAIYLNQISTTGTNITIFWGDGTSNTTTGVSTFKGNFSHTYTQTGQYVVFVSGNSLTKFTIGLTDAGNAEIRSINFFPTGLQEFTISSRTLTQVPETLPSTVTKFSFSGCRLLNSPRISNWNTTNVTNLQTCFAECLEFNQPLSSWNVSNVTNMTEMFRNSRKFNQPLNNWNTAKVTTMEDMFSGAKAFNQPLNNWNTGLVTDMSYMFSISPSSSAYSSLPTDNSPMSFNADITTWNTSNVTTMRSLFAGCTSFNQNISSWNTGFVTDMTNMFQGATSFNQPIGSWNTANVIYMSSMFNGASTFNRVLASWNTSKVIIMNSMFSNATNFNQNLSTWNTGSVIDMSYMFYQATNFNGNITTWDTSKVTSMYAMFQEATSFNQPIGSWNVGQVDNTDQWGSGYGTGNNWDYMFYGATAFDQNLSGWVPYTTIGASNPPLRFYKPTNWDTNSNPNWTNLEKPRFYAYWPSGPFITYP